jgi:aminoglycoside phosphotransferase (APT) family kinase protein
MTEATARTREWLESVALPGRTIAATRRLSGGYRNNNLLLECADGARFVLRRYLGDNRCAVEAALARLLDGVVPVAPVVAADPGDTALLLEFVPGTPVDVLLKTVGENEAHAVGVVAGQALAAIGTVEFDQPGFFSDAELRPEPMSGDLAGFVGDCLRRADPRWDLTESEQDGLRALAVGWTPLVPGDARLVHADFNPKNLLAERTVDGWLVTVLDWEFAFSGSPLTDLGNVLRFGETPFTDGVVAGAGPLPGGWREAARALDLFAVADFLTRPPRPPISRDIRGLVRRLAREG